MSKKSNIKLSVQYINVIPGKKIVTREEMDTYSFNNLEKIDMINMNEEMAFDYLMMIVVGKIVSTMSGVERIALIRSTLPKYPGLQIIIEGDIRADKSLMPKFINWEKLENHQKSLDDLLPLYYD